ncbi:MAG: C25 family cysteine peptidase, partial [bacterium]
MYTKKTYPGLVIIILITLWIAILPDIGSALTARSHIGPGLAYYSGRETWTFLLFKGHNNDYIWEGRYKGGVWEGLGQVHDQDSTSWAFTDHEPVAFTYHLHAIETGVMPRTSRWWLYLVFNGHNNDYVWYTRKEIHEAYASVYMGDWETPRLIPGTDTDLSPGAAMHDWGAGDEVLTIGYTGDDGRIHIKRAAYDFYHQTPYEWQSVTSLPSTAKSSDGPALISYNGKLYVFYRGTGTNYKIYYAVARNNNPTNPDWEISQIPYAYSTHTPSVTEYKGDLIVTFKGHNNQYIWIRRYDNETGEWQNMGYVKDLKTDQRPDIESTGNWLTLAFRAPNYANTNLCVGSLILDENLRGDKPGHTWYKTTGDLCCPEDGLAVYDLLIITPGEFTAALQPLVDHKNATNCPTLMVNLDSIYSNSTFSGDDEPEKIKRAIEFYEKYFGIKYVMLVGDCTRFPVRWQLGHFVDRLIEDSDPDNNDRVYLPSDFYYADLYYGDRNFNDWDADNDRYYGEIYADNLNPDNIDPIPDVGLARVPATNSAQLETYVAKVIRYEYSPLIKKILMIQKGWSTHIGTKENIAAFLAPLGIDTIRLYEDIDPSDYPGTPDDIPTANNISSRLNNRVGFVSHLYHSSPQNWNYLYSISNIRNNLHNSSALPVIYSNGCQTAQFFKATIPYCPYLGVDGLEHGGGVSVGDVGDTVYIRPAVIQPDSYNILSISEAFLLENDNGAIAYYGCSETGEPTYHKYLEEFFFKAYSLGETILGDMWMYSVREFADFYDLKNLVADNSWGRTCKMHTPSRFILFGDPSVRVGGVGNLT